MKKIKKMLCSMLVIAFCMLNTCLTVFAAPENNDIICTKEQLEKGITVVITKNNVGEFEQNVYYDMSNIPMMCATADGELEWAAFHLGFKDWNEHTNDLYYTVSADEPLVNICGRAYVKSTSVLNPIYYHDDIFEHDLPYSTVASRDLAWDIDTGDEEKVRVGFTGVIIKSSHGQTGAFLNKSLLVDR